MLGYCAHARDRKQHIGREGTAAHAVPRVDSPSMLVIGNAFLGSEWAVLK